LEIEKLLLKEADRIEIVCLMDNTFDYLSSSSKKEVQPYRQWNKTHRELPFAEHGFSLLIKAFSDKKAQTILFDAGISPNGVVENARRLGVKLSEITEVVLSHGHYDHFGGLISALKEINNDKLRLLLHDDMTKRRGTVNAKGEIREYPLFPPLNELTPTKICYTKQPELISDDLACVTGEIARTVDFEEGLMHSVICRDGIWQPDPLILDERALVFNLKGKGLVIISGCAHAGIINTIRYAKQITGVNKIQGVFGGFHLAGREFEKRIPATVAELQKIGPKLVVPSHCTGWRALKALSEAFPDGFIFNCVGNSYTLE
jgi:7,8-dihydropterin-6-yl-methyl-4-(beta-D-ribofuranosyl)aminobenzene 5'-phosphate synthase